MYRNASSTIVHRPKNPARPLHSEERTRRWGFYEIASSILLVGLSLIFVVAIAALVIHLIGYDSLPRLYGFEP